ncbi:MAG: C-5 sterol desaturase [Flavobacteriaceae bacterium]|nr:MAG: C-5 sterol desaturase [Flavobacteriaceae bacterium]
MNPLEFLSKYSYPIALPFFGLLIGIEFYLDYKSKREDTSYQRVYQAQDTWVNLFSALGYIISATLLKSLKFGVFYLAYKHFALFEIPTDKLWSWILLFFLDDFTFYWGHRMGHTVNLYWTSHLVHHSSEKFNFTTALRKTWTYDLTGHFLLWIWLPVLGFDPLQVMVMTTLNFIYQFWIHTEKINKMPLWFEWIFNTPSHHRVHHGSNLKYLDKNHGGVLIIWDRLFGTFQEEQEPARYGILFNINTFNLFKVEFMSFKELFEKLQKSDGIIETLKILFYPPGWSKDKSTLTVKEMLLKDKEHSRI